MDRIERARVSGKQVHVKTRPAVRSTDRSRHSRNRRVVFALRREQEVDRRQSHLLPRGNVAVVDRGVLLFRRIATHPAFFALEHAIEVGGNDEEIAHYQARGNLGRCRAYVSRGNTRGALGTVPVS